MDMTVAIRNHKKSFYMALAAFLLVYLPIIYELIKEWYSDPNYSHGFLIPVISAYLIWRKRQELIDIQKSISGSGLILIIVGIILFILGNAGAEYFTVRFSMIVVLFGLVLYYLGTNLIRRVWFEILFLLFMIPVPYVIYFSAAFPMQLMASKVSVFLLNGLGMPVIRQGNIIHLANQSLEVAEACSGLRSLISLLALGAIYSYLSQRQLIGKILLFLSTIPIAVVGNIFRVFLTSIIVYSFEADITSEPIHSLMGASVFVISFILLFICGAIIGRIFK